MKVNEMRTVVGGLTVHCVSPPTVATPLLEGNDSPRPHGTIESLTSAAAAAAAS